MDEQRADPQVTIASSAISELRRYLADQPSIDHTYNILRAYVRNAHMVAAEEVDNEAFELLQEVVKKALELADKYHGAGVRPWLLRIAQNLIKQRKERRSVYQQKEVLLSDIHQQNHPALDDEEFFDVFTAQIAQDCMQLANLREDLKNALLCLADEDQHILNLYIHYGYKHDEVARLLHIKSGAARTRYCRAVSRLRDVWMAQNENRREGSDA